MQVLNCNALNPETNASSIDFVLDAPTNLLAVEECACFTIVQINSFNCLLQLLSSPLQHVSQVPIVSSDVTSFDSAAHGPYRHTNTPIITPIIRTHDVQMIILKEQHDDDDFDNEKFLRDDLVCGF